MKFIFNPLNRYQLYTKVWEKNIKNYKYFMQEDLLNLRSILGSMRQTRVLNTFDNGILVANIGLINKEKILVLVDTRRGEFVLRDIKYCKKLFTNDRYSKYFCQGGGEFYVSIMNPASEDDIQKYAPGEKVKIIESYTDYLSKIQPKIDETDMTWITNIFEGKSERNRVLYNDEKFMLLIDMKWDGRDRNELYCVAFFKDTKLRSIRDLTSEHIPLINHIYSTSVNVIYNKYKINEEHLRCYFHYHPSFWQLHLHFNLTKNKVNGTSVDVAHHISSVIENLKCLDNYYQTVDIPIVVKEKYVLEFLDEE